MKGRKAFKVLFEVIACIVLVGSVLSNVLVPESTVIAAKDISHLIVKEKHDFHVIRGGQEIPVIKDGVVQDPVPIFNVGDRVRFIYRFRIDNLIDVEAGDSFKIDLPDQQYIHIPDSLSDLPLESGTGEPLGVWKIQDGQILATVNDLVASSDWAENGFFEVEGKLIREGKNIEIQQEGDLTITIDIEPDPGEEPGEPGDHKDIPELPERFDDFYKEGNQWSGENIIHWNTSFNLDQLRNMFNGVHVVQKRKMMFIDELAPQTFLLNQPSINVPIYFPTKEGKLGDNTMAVVDLVKSGLAEEMIPKIGETKEEFSNRMQESGAVVYGVYDNTLFVSLGDVPGNGITYYDVFGGKESFESEIDKLVHKDKILQEQADRMKMIYGSEGPTQGSIVGFGICFDVVVEGETGDYKNQATLKWMEDGDETDEIEVKFTRVTGGLDVVKAGSVLINKVDGETGARIPGVVFQLLKWNDSEGKYEQYTPRDGGEVQRKTDGDGKVTFAKLEDGSYKIEEVEGVEGYLDEVVITPDNGEFKISSSDERGFTFKVENFAKPALVEKMVKKVWEDGENQDGLRPAKIGVQLYGDDKAVGAEIELNAGNNWSYTWKDLPEKANGKTIKYTVKETGVPKGYESASEVIDGRIVLTNRYTPGVTKISTQKVWEDGENQDGLRPAKIGVQLYGDDKAVGAEIELNAGNNWSYTWKDLPEKANGHTIKYTVKETGIPKGYESSSEVIDGRIVLTNRYTPGVTKISTQKVWEDGENQDGLRPAKIGVQLYGDDKAVGAEIELNAGNNWSYTWKDLPEKASGKTIKYTVKETGVPKGYESASEVIDGRIVLTNRHTPAVTTIRTEKVWEDGENQDGLRPAKIGVQLYGDDKAVGAEIELNAGNNWSYTWKDLPEKANGKTIKYTVKEIGVPKGYESTSEVIDGRIVLTNRHTPGVTKISTQKVWEDGEDQDGLRPGNIRVQLYGDGEAVGDEVILNVANNWRYTWKDLPEKASGKTIKYTVKETGVPKGYESTSKVIDGRIVLTNRHTPGVTKISTQKVWEDGEDQDGLRPGNIRVQLYGNGEAVGDEVILNVANNWRYTWKDLPEKTNGKTIKYTVKETGVPKGYESTSEVIDGRIVLTNRHTPGVTRISTQKVWEDGENQDGLRPAKISVQLYGDDKAVGTAIELNAGNNWSYTWKDLPEKANGKTIKYTVKETGVPKGYESTSEVIDGRIVLTNRHTPGVTKISTQKVWEDGENQDGLRPAKIGVQLYGDDKAVGAEIELNAGNNWSYTWKDLPEKANGKTIKYTVKEIGVPKGYESTSEVIDGRIVLTNRHTPGVTKISTQKVWEDGEDQDGLRPGNIRVQLYGDGEAVGDEVILNVANNWRYTWKDLPEKANGNTIKYTVKETGIPKGYESTSEVIDGRIVLTNRYTPGVTKISTQKVWEDGENQDGLRPAKIGVQLYGDDKAVGAEIELNAGNNWSYTWKDLPEKASGKTIKYTVKETGVRKGYESTSEVIDGRIVLTNRHTPAVTTIRTEKVWEDGENQDGLRPAKIGVQLYGDDKAVGTEIELNADNNWSYTWKELPEKANGNTIKYTVKETGVPKGYESTSEVIDGRIVLTNRHTPGVTKISTQKVWEDGENQDGLRPAKVGVQLYGDDKAVGTEIELNADNNWSYTWKDLPEKANGKTIKYTVKETGVPKGYESTSEVIDGRIVLTNRHTPAVTTIRTEKVWEDGENQDGLRPAKIGVQLYGDDKAVGTEIELNAGNNWSYTWKDLPEKANGKTIKYTVKETGVPKGYKSTSEVIDGRIVLTNRHTPAVTTIRTEKVWEDGEDQDGLRPGNIRVQLYGDGEAVGDEVILNVANNWCYTWKDLPEKAKGHTIKYTVKETGVPKGYESTSEVIDGRIVLTNRHTPAVTTIRTEKVWEDGEDQDGLRPAKIGVQLYGDDKAVGTEIELNAGNNWSYTWKDLPEKAKGNTIKYTVKETGVPKGYESTSEVIDGRIVLTNRHTPAVTTIRTEKVWEDGENQDGLRPENIRVQLYGDGEAVGDEVILNTANNWNYTWKDLPEKAKGKTINYEVKETGIPKGYKSTSEMIDGRMVITNHYTPEMVTIRGEKVWEDNDDQAKKRPESITVNLLANNKVIISQEVTAKTGWAYQFVNLPKYIQGAEVAYRITEDVVPEYTTNIEGNTIINSYILDKTNVRVTKYWDDQNNSAGLRPKSVKVQLLADGEKYGEEIILNEANDWKYTWQELEAKNKKGEKIKYTIAEVDVPEGYKESITDDGTGNIIVTNTYKVDKPLIKKDWILPKTGEEKARFAILAGVIIIALSLLIYIVRRKNAEK
ncbi:Cna B-type domain-containing protein [Vagococcus elongatus]|nr:Cna B-type domain-containing protein [Vagococcus elongatus]